jgi:hypothetical protein
LEAAASAAAVGTAADSQALQAKLEAARKQMKRHQASAAAAVEQQAQLQVRLVVMLVGLSGGRRRAHGSLRCDAATALSLPAQMQCLPASVAQLVRVRHVALQVDSQSCLAHS